MRKISMLSALLLTIAGLAVSTPASAITCGATVTGDAYLTHDLTCASGITVTGDARVDLRGHRLSGPGASSGAFGITVGGFGVVTVRRGRLTGWGVGIAGRPNEYPDDNTVFTGSVAVDRVTFSANGTGIDGSGVLPSTARSREFVVTRSRFTGNGSGAFGSWARIAVRKSTFTANGQGVTGTDASLQVSNSTLVRNGIALNCAEAGCTFDHNSVLDNQVGIKSWNFATAIVTDSRLQGNDVAYTNLNYDLSKLTGNRFINNGTGLELTYASRITVTRNIFRGNRAAVTDTVVPDPYDDETHPTLIGNRLSRNGDAINLTIHVDLRDNSATRNTGWGIHAPAATDLGGNTARRNGNSPQCTGVSC